MGRPITIVGGGLAGLTLGIGLRQRGVETVVYEAGHYPRHRVCGEFISGAGQGALERLGLLNALKNAGARFATSAAFFDGPREITNRPLPGPAICLSRFILDDLLAREFTKLGGTMRIGERSTQPFVEGVVRASGRRVETNEDGWRLFGLKVHARNVTLEADLEMHFVPDGYVGICRLSDDEANICGLFRTHQPVPDLAHRWRDWLAGPKNSILRQRLSQAQFVEHSFCSVAGISLKPHFASQQQECALGDSLTMIPPVTGNGMSMAFESAELAIDPLAQYSRGELSWEHTRKTIALSCDKRFGPRLRFAARIQQAIFRPLLRAPIEFLARHSDHVWKMLFQNTR